jgi:hypothetical protein
MDDATLVQARWIGLHRKPMSPGAASLVNHVIDTITPYLQGPGTRPIGHKALPKLREDIGAILAGVMLANGGPVGAPRGKSSELWKMAPMGDYRFWTLADAMIAAGLLGHRKGTKGNFRFGVLDGQPAKLWPLPALLEAAAARQVTTATRATDWTPDPNVVAKPVKTPKGVLVEPWRGMAVAMTPEMEREREGMAAALAALNDLNATVTIRGAGSHVSLRRKFLSTLAFGGRFYGPAYLNISEDARRRITFDGEPCVEVDVKASLLTLIHGLTGQVGPGFELPRLDLYEVPDIPRDVAKAWTIRTLGRGLAKWKREQWSKKDDPGLFGPHPVASVRAAMLDLYPFLSDFPAMVPPEVIRAVPSALRCIASGQYLIAREAAVVASAISYCVAQACPVLPVHDALLVPASREHVARKALEGAYIASVGVRPVLET